MGTAAFGAQVRPFNRTDGERHINFFSNYDEIPPASAGRLVDALTDIIRPWKRKPRAKG